MLDGDDGELLLRACQYGFFSVAKFLLHYQSDNSRNIFLDWAVKEYRHDGVINLFFADPNINIAHVKFLDFTSRDSQLKFLDKLQQDRALFYKVKEVAEGKNGDKLLKEIEDLLNKKSKYGFKPSLNYSLDDSDENTAIKIAIKAGGELLQLLYDYAKKNIGTDTETFKRLKQAKEQQENSRPKSSLNDVTIPNKLAQTQVSTK